jgi:hypothetical protein
MIPTLLLGLSAVAAPVQGRVLERGTSRPLPDVDVRHDTEQVRTDSDGRFELDLPAGVLTRLVIEDLEHRPIELDVVAPVADLRVFLEPVAPMEIVVESFRPSAHPTVHRVDAEQAYETPGTQDDAVRLVQSLPGVTVQREFSPSSGDLSVRGSAPGDNRYYLDGIEIPYLYHFNQYASVFPTTQLRGLELFPSTFGSRYGDAVGAVVEAESRSDAPTDIEGQLTFNTIIAGADLRVPVGKQWWLAVAGRRSYQDLYSGSTAQYTLWPVFHDTAVRLERGDEDRGTGVFLVTAGDGYERAVGELDILDPVEAEAAPSFRYRRAFQVLGLRHRWSRDDGGGRLVAAVVHDNLNGELRGTGQQHQRTLTVASRLDHSQAFGASKHRWGAGYELRAGMADLLVTGAGPTGVLVSNEAPALGRGEDVDGTIPRLEGAVYGEAMVVAGDLRLIPGLRIGADSLSGTALVEPRLAARWRLAEQSALKAAVGRYVQTPALLDLVDGPGDPELPNTRSLQGSVGFEQTIANRLELNLDAYAKLLSDAQLPDPEGPPEVFEQGRALGVELITRYRLRERFFLWGWAGLARTQVKDGARWRPAAYDQPLNLGLVASWDPNQRWNLALRWRYGSGLPWTPVTGSVYDGTVDTWNPVLGESYSERFPAYTKLDLVVGYRFTFERWSLALRAELWYVPPRSNVLYPTWNDDWSEQGWVRGIPALPLLGARASF